MTQVIIDDVIPRTQLIAAAGQTVFNTNWTANATTDILVYARADGVEPDDETQLVSSSDYNVTFIGGSQTVRVTFLVGRTLDDVITIVRNTPAERLNLYINTNFVPSMLNEDFGILTLVDQQAQMYDTVVTPHYNVSATIDPDSMLGGGDVILPILPPKFGWRKNAAGTAIEAISIPDGGFAPADATYLIQVADVDLPNAQAMAALASGFVVNTTSTGVQLTRVFQGTADQIDIADPDGIGGNPVWSIADNVILGGTSGMGLIRGTTAERPLTPGANTFFRFNTTDEYLEYWDGANWIQIVEDAGVLIIHGTANQIDVDSTDPAEPILSLSATLDAPGTFTIQGSTAVDEIINDDTLATATATNLATALAIKTYIDNKDIGVETIVGTANEIDVDSTDPNNPVLSLSATLDAPGTFTVQGSVAIDSIIDDDTFGTATDTNIPTSESVKAYVDAQVAGSVTSVTGTEFQVLVDGTFGTPETGAITLTLPQDIAPVSSPEFVDLTLTGGNFLDANGNTMFDLLAVASSVNHLRAVPSATGFPPELRAVGTDTNVGYVFRTQAAGAFEFITQAPTSPFTIYNGTLSQHTTVFSFANTAAARTVTFQDADGTLAFVGDLAGYVQSVTGTANQIDVDNTDPQNPILSLSSTLIAPGTIAVGNLLFDTNTISSTDTNGDLILTPDGTGNLVLDGVNWPQADGTAGYFLQTDGAGQTSWQPVSGGSGTVTAASINEIAFYPANGDTVDGIPTANSAMFRTDASGVPGWSASMTDGQLLIGDTSGTPVPGTLTAGPGISIANGPGSITISGTGSGIGWTEVTGTTQAMAADNGYVANNGALVVFTLPTTAAFGTVINLVGKGAGGWRIDQNSGQNIQVGSVSSTVGTGGSVASTNRFDSLELLCTTADTTWTVLGGPQTAGFTIV